MNRSMQSSMNGAPAESMNGAPAQFIFSFSSRLCALFDTSLGESDINTVAISSIDEVMAGSVHCVKKLCNVNTVSCRSAANERFETVTYWFTALRFLLGGGARFL